jgi:uncharacterized protein (TIGR02266 family)
LSANSDNLKMGSSAPGSKTVLVADETDFVRDRFRTALEGAGHRAVLVSSAPELLERLRGAASPVDLVLLDVRLSRSSGVSLVRAVRDLIGDDMPILVFSGTIASSEEVRALARLGVAGYINEYSAVAHIVRGLSPHLAEEEAANRRSSPRVVLGVPVTYRIDNRIMSGLTLNLSRGGLAIRTAGPLTAGVLVRVRFRLPGGSGEIDASARVAWSDRRVGMGLQFDTVSPADQRTIDDFVDQHFFSNRKA